MCIIMNQGYNSTMIVFNCTGIDDYFQFQLVSLQTTHSNDIYSTIMSGYWVIIYW